jgi:ubiquinone/menaquinone biosynthesis C-methylase UbiE
VLDCGTGTGALLEAFAREFAECGGKGANLRGMDRSPRMLYKAAERFKAAGLEGAFQRGECERLPYDSGSFDFVMTAHMLEHVEDVHAAIREMSRVLRPGGLLLAIVTRPGVIDALFRLLWRYQTVREDTLRSAFWEAGLARISRAPVGRVISPARWLSSAYLAVKTGEGRPFRARPLHSETIPSGAAR